MRPTETGPGGGPRRARRIALAERLRRRTLAPGRPLLHPDQAGLVVFTVAALGAGTYVVVRHLL
jgi:hypothetical protein